MGYDLKDAWQAALGTIVATLFFFMLRSGQPIIINPTIGIGIGCIWIYITGSPFLNGTKDSRNHFILNILVAVGVASALAVTFQLITVDQIFSYNFFGTGAWLGALLGIKYAQFYDKMNITNEYSTWYHKRRTK